MWETENVRKMSENVHTVLKSMFGLMMRSLFNIVRHLTDQDPNLVSSFIVATLQSLMKYLNPNILQEVFLSEHSRNSLHLTKYSGEFHSLLRVENEAFLASYIRLWSWYSYRCWYSIIRSITGGSVTKRECTRYNA